MELTGRVVKLLPLQKGVSQSTGNEWQRQDFLFGSLKEGDQIKVRVGLTCREYPQGSGKYFNDIRTGDITVIKRVDEMKPAGGENGGQVNNNPQPQQNAPTVAENNAGGDADDLPF